MVLIVFLDTLHCNGHKLVPCSPLFVEGDLIPNGKFFNIFFFIKVIAEDLCSQFTVLHAGGNGGRNKCGGLRVIKVIQCPCQHVDGLCNAFFCHMGRGRHCTGCGGTGAAAGRQCDASSQNSRHGQHFFIQSHILSLLLISVGKVCSVPRPYHTPPARKCQLFQPRALDVRFVFRYNKNESRTHFIATDFKIERNIP
jgi:hypothetical protein